MHSSLKLQTNIFMIIACALVAGVFSILTHPFPAIPMFAGTIFGLVAGLLQSQSIIVARDAFRSAETAMAVRQALMSTTSGKRAIQIQWVLLPILLVSAYRLGNPLGGAVAGFALFMCVRDLMALKAVIGLTQATGPAE
jgi:xanthosine utilization system XapX-like protein